MIKTSYQVLNRDMIKYIAMLAMLLNHIAIIFMQQGELLTKILINIGYLTAITMCYFLVEGYNYTHSKKRYALRLGLFALISELPYCLALTEAFTGEKIIAFCGFNMMFTLLLCFLILLVNEKISNFYLKSFIIMILIFISTFCDWALFAPLFTLLFIWARDSKIKHKLAFIVSIILFGLFNYMGNIGSIPSDLNLLLTVGNMVGISIGGIMIVYLYNGTQGQKNAFSKWFFYWFYPIHLFILGVIRIVIR